MCLSTCSANTTDPNEQCIGQYVEYFSEGVFFNLHYTVLYSSKKKMLRIVFVTFLGRLKEQQQMCKEIKLVPQKCFQPIVLIHRMMIVEQALCIQLKVICFASNFWI